MSNSSQSPPNEPITNDNSLPLQPEQSSVLSGFFGPFGLLRSPLFIIITISIASITALVVDQSQKLEISILLGLFVQLIATVVIWQFLLLSKRLEDITSRSADLQGQAAVLQGQAADLRDFVKTAKQHFGSSRAAHGFTHRMLGEMGGDQSRILQSTEELKRAVKLIYDQIEIFCNYAEGWKSQNAEQFDDVAESLNILKSKTDKDWQNQVLKQFDEITISLGTIVDESIRQFGLTRETLEQSNLSALTEVHKGVTELVKDTDKHQQQSLKKYMRTQNTSILKKIRSAQTKLKADTKGADKLQQQALKQFMSAQISSVLEQIETAQIKLKTGMEGADEHQQQVLKQFMSKQISSVLEQIETAQIKLKTDMHGDVKQSITELKTNLTESLPEKTALALDKQLRTQSAEMASTLAKLDEKIGRIKGHVSSVEGEVINLANRESNISEALSVSTSLDRLNLEFRRQLVELRKELDIKQPS